VRNQWGAGMGRPQPATNRSIQFGVFDLDLRAGELRKRGVKVKLQEQPLQVLQILLENPGELVTREELQQRIWPADTFVDFEHGLNNAIRRLREALGDSADTPHYVETLARRGYRFIGSLAAADAAPAAIPSLAVLPLENLSRDPEQEYFADGLTEALITNLAKIGGLRVTSRTTAMHYKGVHRPVPEIARELGVSKVVEGTVLRSGARVRISAQLIEAATDAHLWAESYERDMQDILALQSEVAHAIASEVRIKLTPQERTELARTRQVDPDAYEAYLKGRFHWNKRNIEGLTKGTEYFQQAIEKDPSYAPAYAGLADSAGILGWWCFVPPEQGCGQGKAAALKALAVDDTIAEAHASLAWNLLHYDFDFLAAEKEFQRALELNPRYSNAIEWHAVSLAVLARLDEAVSEAMRAVQLDPLSPMIITAAGMIFWLARKYDRAADLCRRALDLVPDFSLGRWALAMVLSQKGMHDAAIAEMEDLVRTSRGLPLFVHLLGNCYATAGRRDDAFKVLDQLHEIPKQRYMSAYWPATIYAALNEKDQAFHWLDRAYQEHSPWVAYTKVFPWLDNLRSDPRFQDLLRRMNFPA
jgi:TolB-like protein